MIRTWCSIKIAASTRYWYVRIFSLHVCSIMYGCYRGKFHVNHFWELKGQLTYNWWFKSILRCDSENNLISQRSTLISMLFGIWLQHYPPPPTNTHNHKTKTTTVTLIDTDDSNDDDDDNDEKAIVTTVILMMMMMKVIYK